ncbi:MAG: hypothetical protein A4E26_00023 [Methanobacterium sp. PtaU1.Bin097]|jgi:hypothetical protein|nr:MAG: hypothetical protein A4E26_00023 [Methanobacterium sp. PtaU1.Bin097]
MVVKIPKLYRTRTIEIDTGEEEPIEIEIRGYRPADIDIAAKLQSLRNELPALFNKLKVFRDLQQKLIEKAKEATGDEPISEDELENEFIDGILSLDDNEFTEEELQELEDSKVEVDRINKEMEEYASVLGQRGLKRFFYKDDKDYKEAESSNTATDYIDQLPDIEIDQDYLLQIAYAMIELSAPNQKLQRRLEKKAADKGKSKKGKRKPSKKP